MRHSNELAKLRKSPNDDIVGQARFKNSSDSKKDA